MQVSRDKKDQIRTVERFLLDQHATFRNNLNRFGEPLPQQIAVFLRDLQDGLLAKLQLVNNPALVEIVKSNARKYLNEINWDFAKNKAFESRMPPRVQKIEETLGLMANRLLTPPTSRRISVAPVQGVKSVKAQAASEATELYIGSLPYAATEDEIKAVFNKVGKVVSLTIIRDRMTGQSKGFGFIGFADANAARVCMEGTHYLHGRRIVVNHNNRAVKNPSQEPGGAAGPSSTPAAGPVGGYVPPHARPPHARPPHARPPHARPPHPSGSVGSEIDPNSIYVQNIPQSANDADLAAVFHNWGQVSRAKVVMDPVTNMPKGFGFVTFESAEDAGKVLAEGTAIMHGTRIAVMPKRIANHARGRSGRFGGGGSPRHRPFHGRPRGMPPRGMSPRGMSPRGMSPRASPRGYRGADYGYRPPQHRGPPRGPFPPSLPAEDPHAGVPEGRPAAFDGAPPASRPLASPRLAPPPRGRAEAEAPGTPEAAPAGGGAPARQDPRVDRAAVSASVPPSAANQEAPPPLQSALRHLMSNKAGPETGHTGPARDTAAYAGHSGPQKHRRPDDGNSISKRRRKTDSSPLPHGWIKRQSKRKNRVFYFHVLSKRSQWHRPTSSAAPQS